MPETARVVDEARSEPEDPEVVRAWADALDAMELHLDEIRAGLEVGALPSPYEVSSPGGRMPACLTPRALRLAAVQRDVEELLRKRLAVLSSVLSGAFERGGTPPGPVFFDRRG